MLCDKTKCTASRAFCHPPKRWQFKLLRKQTKGTENKEIVTFTFFLSSSLRSKAHFCLHCSQVTGGPYFFSELVHRWHLLPIKAAMMLQYSQAEGLPYCFTLDSHFLQMVLVLPLLIINMLIYNAKKKQDLGTNICILLPFLLKL